jgi:hypothetical protein
VAKKARKSITKRVVKAAKSMTKKAKKAAKEMMPCKKGQEEVEALTAMPWITPLTAMLEAFFFTAGLSVLLTEPWIVATSGDCPDCTNNRAAPYLLRLCTQQIDRAARRDTTLIHCHWRDRLLGRQDHDHMRRVTFFVLLAVFPGLEGLLALRAVCGRQYYRSTAQ